MKDIKNLTYKEIQGYFLSIGEPRYRADEVFKAIYFQKVESFTDITNLPMNIRKKLSEDFYLYTFETGAHIKSEDGTQKFLFKLKDGSFIESVLMESENKFNKKRKTVCLSTQVGCPFSCAFCATGKMGFKRNLLASEIVEQFLFFDKIATINNVVLMGMGEPFLNYNNVKKFIEIISDEHGRAFGRRKITVSTSGIIDKIYQITDEIKSIKIAISLHSAIQEKRDMLMPQLKVFKLKDLKEAIAYYVNKTGNTITIEYILINGVNDSEKDAKALVNYLSNLKFVKVNLISYNEVNGVPYKKSDREVEFQRFLLEKGIRATLRISKGQSIKAACGQLATKHIKRQH